MANHVKPSRQELEANVAATIQQLDTPASGEPSTPVETVHPDVVPQDATPVTTKPQEDVVPTSPEVLVEPEHVDTEEELKKKFAESARQAQAEAQKNKEITQAIQESAQIPEPTEEELKKENPEWEEMTPLEKRLAKEAILNRKKFEYIQTTTAKFQKANEFVEKITTFADDPRTLINYPELEGKQRQFIAFATEKPERRVVNFSDLVLMFNGEMAKNKPAPKKGQMFERGTGGVKEPPKPADDKLSVEEGRALMKSDYKKWKEMLRLGKIKNE